MYLYKNTTTWDIVLMSCFLVAVGSRVSEQADGSNRVQLIKSSDMCLKLIK